MTMGSFDQTSGYLRLIKEVTGRYQSRISAAAAEQGLSKPEADVLLFLSNNPQYHTAREVVLHRGLSKAYVSKAVERLAERGFLTVTVSEADRRVQHLLLTAAAREAVYGLRRAQGQYFRQLTEGVTAAETAALERLMEQVWENLGKMG